MTPRLTDEQRDALAAATGPAVEVEDAVTHVKYVLLPAETYERVRSAVEPAADADANGDEEYDPSWAYPLVAEALAEVWDDPAMDVYNDYDAAPKP